MVVCLAGSIVGYSWARLVGERGLIALAQRLHQQRNLERVSNRVRSAGWVGVAVSRLIPGLRIYTTLVAGAVRVPRRTFIVAMVPSTIVWVAAFVALGTVVGIPVEHFFTRVEELAVQGVILVVMGLGIFLAIRRTPPSTGAGLVRVPRVVRACIAAGIDAGVIFSIVTGLLALGRRLFGVGIGAGWLDAIIPMVVGAIIYIVAARRSAGATVGEALLQTSYISGRQIPRRPQEAWQAARALLAGSPDELRPTADLLRALADPDRLRLVRHLIDRPRTADELSVLTGTECLEVQHQLDRLLAAGVLAVQAEGEEARSQVRPELVAPLLEFLSAARRPDVTVAGAGAGRGDRAGAGATPMAEERPPAPVPASRDLARLRAAAAACAACDLVATGTQTVFGEGERSASIMLVGEQPGDVEDREGRPFVGPAGRVLDEGLEAAGIDRERVYVTNAVKHFKWTPRGKRRIHATPNGLEVAACRPWLDAEIEAVRPDLVVCLGATAAQALLGREFRVTRHRGEVMTLEDGTRVSATVHPSSILRMPDEAARHAAMEEFVHDLRSAARDATPPRR